MYFTNIMMPSFVAYGDLPFILFFIFYHQLYILDNNLEGSQPTNFKILG